MGEIGLAALSGHFGRNLDANFLRIEAVLNEATSAGANMVVFPDAALGGYLPRFYPGQKEQLDDLPPSLDPQGPEIKRLITLAKDLVICVGYCEQSKGNQYNSAICVSGDGILGHHRKVHQPIGEKSAYASGNSFKAFDTPIGKIGMLIDYDKTFPESSRSLAIDGAKILAILSAWPASLTNRAPRIASDRQTWLFDLYDCVRAAENQVIVVSANQTGTFGRLTFLGRSKIVGPGGNIIARTSAKAGLVAIKIDVDAEIAKARNTLNHLNELRIDAYRQN